jgi:hypothetical protein
MIIDQISEIVNFPDPFWLEHGEQIRTIREVLETPKTRVGEEILKSVFDQPVFMVYNRLHPIFSSLVTLAEYDEIGKAEGKSYFSEPLNQRMILKAIKLLIEDKIKFPYSEEEKKKYEDYRKFFEGVTLRLGQLDKQIQTDQRPPNFVNSLAIIISQETTKLKGVENFGINMEGARKKIADYLPQLAQIDDGGILSEIKARLERPLVGQPQDK